MGFFIARRGEQEIELDGANEGRAGFPLPGPGSFGGGRVVTPSGMKGRFFGCHPRDGVKSGLFGVNWWSPAVSAQDFTVLFLFDRVLRAEFPGFCSLVSLKDERFATWPAGGEISIQGVLKVSKNLGESNCADRLRRSASALE